MMKRLHTLPAHRMKDSPRSSIFGIIISFVLFPAILSGLTAHSQPVITVRFANPEFDCVSQVYTVDVEFQSNTPDQQLNAMNVRFWYDDDILEFVGFGEFVNGYGPDMPNPPQVTNYGLYAGQSWFGFTGPADYVSGAIKKISTTINVYISTTDWTKLFNMSFLIDDPAKLNQSEFCPSLVWDLEADPSNGGYLYGSEGVVISLISGGATENVIQHNWQYSGMPGEPYGFPTGTNCNSTLCGLAPKTYLPTGQLMIPGSVDIPVSVTDFNDIGAFNLSFEYDPFAMEYVGYTPNEMLAGGLEVTDAASAGGKRKINLHYTGSPQSLMDDSELAVLQFFFITGGTELLWMTDGVSCKYFNSEGYVLFDMPYSEYYMNGAITLLAAPVTKIDPAVAEEGLVTFPVRVSGYNNIQAGSLTLDFDPDVLIYYNVTPNNLINGSFTASISGPGRLQMSWQGNNISLPDESVLVYVTFYYSGGVVPLVWFDDGESCQYICGDSGLPLYDVPADTYYIDGNVAPVVFIWTGQESGDWYTSANWLDGIIPSRFSEVMIDPDSLTGQHWPSFMGDFTLGIHCIRLTLIGDAQFSVSGDLEIYPGHVLEMTDSGLLFIGGSWTNSGIFSPGNGIVEFTGTDNAAIAIGVPPENYIAAFYLTTFNTEMIPVSGGTPGPSGNNSHMDVGIGFDFQYLGTVYSQVRINTNGWLSFNLSGDDETSHDNSLLFETLQPTTALAAWWDDLNADEYSSINYITTGTAPDRIFTAEWKDVLSYSTGSTARLNFQVKLYETSNIIEFYYGDLPTGTHNVLEGASIGIKDATGGPGNFREVTLNTTHIPFPCLQSPNDWPDMNYRFTPPVESETEMFHRLIVSKVNGVLAVQKDTHVTGMD